MNPLLNNIYVRLELHLQFWHISRYSKVWRLKKLNHDKYYIHRYISNKIVVYKILLSNVMPNTMYLPDSFHIVIGSTKMGVNLAYLKSEIH